MPILPCHLSFGNSELSPWWGRGPRGPQSREAAEQRLDRMMQSGAYPPRDQYRIVDAGGGDWQVLIVGTTVDTGSSRTVVL